MIKYSEALEIIKNHSIEPKKKEISLENAFEKILADDVSADRDYPPFFRASMDGFALRFEDFEKGIRDFKIIKNIHAGDICNDNLKENECFKIMTGAAVPLSANMIIRVEDSQNLGNQIVKLQTDKLKKYQNIAQKGEDFKQNDVVLKKGTQINQSEWAVLASLGKYKIKVFQQPKISIISTGNEIKQVNEAVNEVQIRDSNSFTITALLSKFKIKPANILVVKDEENLLKQAILEAFKHEIIIISGGVSAGDADFVPKILEELGVKKLFHKVKIKPGKPIWFGVTESKKVVFALPGNPFSVQVACKIFIEPFLKKCFGMKKVFFQNMSFIGERQKANSLDEFLPVKFSEDKDGVEILKFNGSGDISASLGSDGLMLHSSEDEKLVINQKVKFVSW